MAHTGNDGNPRFKDGPHHDFLIEGPEVFNGTTATTDNQNIQVIPLIRRLDIGCHLLGRSISLYLGGIEDNFNTGKPPGNGGDNILDDRSAWTGDNSDFLDELRQDLFPLRIKKAFLGQGLFQLLEPNGQCPDPIWLSFFNDDGIGTAGLIELDPADDIDFHAFFQLKTEVFVDTAPDGSLDDRLFVLEGKVLMGRPPPEVGHLTCQVNPLQIGISVKF